MPRYNEFPSSQIPESLIAEIAKKLHSYSTALIKLAPNSNNEAGMELKGSGSLVAIENVHGILTAHHVANEFTHTDQLGLTFMEAEHRYQIPWQHIRHVEIASPENGVYGPYGPDLSFLVIPDAYIGTIKTYRSFYLLKRRDDRTIIENDQEAKRDPWFVCGTIGERSTDEKPGRGFSKVKGLYGLAGMSFAEKIYEKGGFDYVEVKAERRPDDTPQSYGGISGGGLWRVPLIINGKGVVSVKQYELAGVAFYQTELDNGFRFLRCHGPNSLQITHRVVMQIVKG